MKNRTNFIIGAILLACSLTIYGLKTYYLGDLGGTTKFLFNAMGVLPLNLLLMTFIFNKLLTVHNKREKKQKRDMLVGVFFSECGNSLLRMMANLDQSRGQLNECTGKPEHWDGKGQEKIYELFSAYKPNFKAEREDLAHIRTALNKEHKYLLTLIDHPALVGHGKFSDLVWALFHLEDELNHRSDFNALPDSDIDHLSGDIARVYNHILSQWVDYIVYLKGNYPYLYSLAIRTSPFKAEADVVIES